MLIINSQGRILAVWILAPKLPNSDLNFAVDFWVDFFLLFFPRKKARKNPPKNPRQNSPGNSVGKIPLGFLQKPSLDKFGKLSGIFLKDYLGTEKYLPPPPREQEKKIFRGKVRLHPPLR